MTVFEFAVGDRAAVETLQGDIRAGEVVDRTVRVDNRRPVPHVRVQVAENVTIERPQSAVSPP